MDKRVERANWHDLPTPPSSPSKRTDGHAVEAIVADDSAKKADALASRILVDLCQPAGSSAASAWTQNGCQGGIILFRTEYRAVENEVAGLVD